MGYSAAGNAHRAVQQFIDGTPPAGNASEQRVLENHRLDALWRMAYGIANDETAEAPHRLMAVRALLECSRARRLLNGLDKPTVIRLDAPAGHTETVAAPSLGELLPAGHFTQETVREQALLLHRALPPASSNGHAS